MNAQAEEGANSSARRAPAPVIRTAEPGDIAAMLAADAYAQLHESRRRFIHEAVARQQCLVSLSGHEVAGLVVLSHDFFEHAFIALLVVAPAFRRRGVGMGLMRDAEPLCRTPKLFTSTNNSNVVAQAFLSKAGFLRSGIIENLDANDAELVYFKRLR